MPCNSDELESLDALFKETFIQKVTRDRSRLDPLPMGMEIVEAFRAESPGVWERYELHRRRVTSRATSSTTATDASAVRPRTAGIGALLQNRVCAGANLANAHLLFHGSNPTSGRSIMQSGLLMDLIGVNKPSPSSKSMFGPGVYLSECVSKADEYSHDGPALDGRFAMVVCRAVVGNAYVTGTPGDDSGKVEGGEYDCVVGDREKEVGTYREFVFFNDSALYPEFLIMYQGRYRTDGGAAVQETGERP